MIPLPKSINRSGSRQTLKGRASGLKRLALACGLIVAGGANVTAVDIPPTHHPWGRFKPNSWQRLRVTTETLGTNDKKSIKISHVTTRLVKVEPDGVTLLREVKQGDKITRESPVKYAWDGSKFSENTREKYSLGEIKIEGKTFACQTQALTTAEDGTTTHVKSWYSPDQPPYFLKRLMRVRGERRENTAIEMVTRLSVGKTALGHPIACWESKTAVTGSETTTITTTYSSLEIPGGTVFSESKVHDKERVLSRRITVELEAYEAAR